MARILMMCLWLTILPGGIGICLQPAGQSENKNIVERALHAWVIGQMILWSVFLAICVPETLLEKSFSDVYSLYVAVSLGIFFAAIAGRGFMALHKKKSEAHAAKNAANDTANDSAKEKTSKARMPRIVLLFWVLAALLALLQIICVFLLAYEEGDDAYYVAVTTMSKDADRLYTKIPYTGAFTGLQGRYALAPFPVWVAVPAKLSGLSGAVASHLVMPVFAIFMSYAILYLIGKKLLEEGTGRNPWIMPVYLCFMELLVIFGGYSTYTKENFLLVRAAQGKAILANIVIPFLFYLMMLLVDKLEKGEKTGVLIWVEAVFCMTAGCLCSTLGSFLLCMLLGLGTLCGAIVYRRGKLLIGLIPCMIIPMLIILTYIRM